MSFSVAGKCHPVLPIDFYEQESYERILESLEKLDTVFNAILSSVEAKVKSTQVTEFQAQVAAIGTRISAASQKVAHLEGSNRGYVIQSCPTFPKVPLSPGIHIQMEHAVPRSEQVFHVNDNFGNPPTMVNRLLSQLGVPASRLMDSRSNHDLVGLGDLPESLSYLTSLLIFNTKSNAYQTVVSELNPDMQRYELDAVGRAPLPQASPLTSQDPLSHVKGEYAFQPESGTALDIQMPKELPISGIAQLEWDDDDDDNSGFIFSAQTQKPKPVVETPKVKVEKKEDLPQLPSLPSPSSPVPDQKPAVQKPVPEIPKAPVLSLPQLDSQPKPASSSQSNPSKVPQAPQLPSLDLPPLSKSGPPKDLAELPKPADPNAREALLDSLRSSNPMAHLRKAPTKAPPKDAMALMKAHMATRFVVIHKTNVDAVQTDAPQAPTKKTEIDISSSDDSD